MSRFERTLGHHLRRRRGENQQKHYHRPPHSSTIIEIEIGVATTTRRLMRHLRFRLIFPSFACSTRTWERETQGEVFMSGQVILYFDDQADALRFALAAGSVMAGDGTPATGDLVQETTRVTRIRLDAGNKGKSRQPTVSNA
jgi:hypothetical protein